MGLVNLNNGVNKVFSRVEALRKDNYSRCGKCDSSWFEEVTITRIVKNHVVVVGQHPTKINGPGPFVLLRCVACTSLHQPNITAATGYNDVSYTEMLKEIDESLAPKPEVTDGAQTD